MTDYKITRPTVLTHATSTRPDIYDGELEVSVDEPALAAALTEFERAGETFLEAVDALAAAREARDDALRAVMAAGVPKTRTAQAAREHLIRQGWSAERVEALGLSAANVALVLGRGR